MSEVLPVRAPLADVKTAAVTSITYPAGDGTMVPAYLTLPAGSMGKSLPAIVMPHGGPASRDEWGFDWLAQFFASRGFAVIQPEFRGSAGYGDAWYVDNGFKSWKIAIRDVTAAGEYLIKRGIADPAKLAIVGWSYGGYAALQSNVLDPDLFKAVIAIAPVTDLRMLKLEATGFTAEDIVQRFIGDGPHITEGSPDLHADRFKAPVLMFHGDQDINVGIAESAAMDAALKHAGKQTSFVRYPGLDHQLDDSAARIDMLTKADTFLHAALKM
jgi:dipeptidyl aminopeptidase/acylaminoacyl peptidase